MNAWSSIQYVGTGLGLVAFIVAALLYAYRARLGQRAEIIKSAPVKERLAAIETTAELFRVDLAGQTSEQRQEIVLKQIEIRARRELLFAGIALVIAILLAAISVIAIVQRRSEPPAIAQNGPQPPAQPLPPQSDSVKLQRAAPKPGTALQTEPITTEVDGVSTYHMVRQIRCETRDSIRKALIAWLSALQDPFSQKLALQYESDPELIRTFHYNLFKGPEYARVREVAKLFYDTGIAYAFDFNPRFTTTDTFGGLLTNVVETYCEGFIATANYTGRIGVDKLITDFIQLSLFANGSGPPTMVHDFTYMPSAGRTDTHTVTVALAISTASNVKQPGRSVVVGTRVTGQGSPSEVLALTAIDQFKGRPAQ